VGATPSTWNFGSTDPRWSEIADFEQIIARSASAVTSGEKVQLTLIGSPLRAFQRAYDDHRTWPLSPKGGLKNAKRPFSSKIAIRLKKVCYKVPLCENCQRKSCRAFIGVTIHAKIVGRDVPFYLKFWVKPRWSEIADFRSIFARSASAVTSSENSLIITNRKSTTQRVVVKAC